MLGEQGFYVRFNVDGAKAAAVPAHWNAVPAHQELLEVPGNVVAAYRRPNDVLGVGHERSGLVTGRWQRLPQEGKEWVSFLTIHLALLEQCKVGFEPPTRSDILEGIQNLFVLGILLGETKTFMAYNFRKHGPSNCESGVSCESPEVALTQPQTRPEFQMLPAPEGK